MRQIKITKQITGRDSYSMEKYLQEISKIRVLSPDEEASLAKKMKKGDSFAKERLILGNLRFVVSVAKQYQNHGLTLGDLINEGNLGLLKAAEGFDEFQQSLLLSVPFDTPALTRCNIGSPYSLY